MATSEKKYLFVVFSQFVIGYRTTLEYQYNVYDVGLCAFMCKHIFIHVYYSTISSPVPAQHYGGYYLHFSICNFLSYTKKASSNYLDVDYFDLSVLVCFILWRAD